MYRLIFFSFQGKRITVEENEPPLFDFREEKEWD
jgi:hypothetical protein